MSQRHPLAVVAGAATLLAAVPLATIFATFSWFFYIAIAIIVVVGTAMLARTVRAPVWAQVMAMMAALVFYLTLVFPSGDEIARLIPTAGTFQHFNDLFAAAGGLIRDETIPVPDSDSLLLLTTAGVGLVALLVDLTAVGLRRPALAGLPMLAIYSVPVAVLPEGLSVLPFGFAAAGYLWLLVADSVDRVRRFGRRFTGEGRDVDVWEPSPLSSAGRRLGVVGLAIAMVLPLAIPGMTSGLIDRFGSGYGDEGPGGSGSGPAGSTVNLTALLTDSLERDKSFDMVKVTTSDPEPFYLKFGVADQITKEGFTNKAPASGTSVARGGIPPAVTPTTKGVTAGRFEARVEAVNFSMPLVPSYSRVSSTGGLDAQWLYDGSTEQIFTRRPDSTINGKAYTFQFVHMRYSQDALRSASSIPAQDNGREIASVPQVPQITDLVRQLTTNKITEYDKVRALYDHFSAANGFQYSLTAPSGTSGSAIVDFLNGKKGFCVQYAGALAWLVRVAGYPARVAFGFTRGAGATNGTYTLTNFNLHAWTEVFFPDFGWVPFDPTPAGSVTGAVQSDWAPDASKPVIGDSGDPDDLVKPGANNGPSISAAPAPNTNPGGSAGPGAQPINTWWLASAAVLVVALFILFAPAWRRRTLRRRRRATAGGPVIVIARDGLPSPQAGALDLVTEPSAVASARRDAHEAWAELLDTMVDFSVPVDESETPRATAVRLTGLPTLEPVVQAPADLLARAEERARYARTPIRADGLNEAVSVTRAALARQASRRQRLSATFLPRSVLLRWRTGWATWLGAVVGRAGRVRDAMTAMSPRRLLARGAGR